MANLAKLAKLPPRLAYCRAVGGVGGLGGFTRTEVDGFASAEELCASAGDLNTADIVATPVAFR